MSILTASGFSLIIKGILVMMNFFKQLLWEFRPSLDSLVSSIRTKSLLLWLQCTKRIWVSWSITILSRRWRVETHGDDVKSCTWNLVLNCLEFTFQTLKVVFEHTCIGWGLGSISNKGNEDLQENTIRRETFETERASTRDHS